MSRFGDWLAGITDTERDRQLLALAERMGEECKALRARLDRVEAALQAHGIEVPDDRR